MRRARPAPSQERARATRRRSRTRSCARTCAARSPTRRVRSRATGSDPINVHVRVEGKQTTIFGAPEPLVDVAATPLDALETASAQAEFYYHVTQSSFGPYVDQIGRYAADGSSGWVFKVNGASPPVGADQVRLAAGDTVLWYWAQFGVAGGPKTLVLSRGGKAPCYRVLAQDDNGSVTPALGAVLHVGKRTVKTQGANQAAVGCVGPHRGLLVRATLAGAVRSNALA